jgi:hypothetical protein
MPLPNAILRASFAIRDRPKNSRLGDQFLHYGNEISGLGNIDTVASCGANPSGHPRRDHGAFQHGPVRFLDYKPKMIRGSNLEFISIPYAVDILRLAYLVYQKVTM